MKACINRGDESVGRQWTMEASVAGLLCIILSILNGV